MANDRPATAVEGTTAPHGAALPDRTIAGDGVPAPGQVGPAHGQVGPAHGQVGPAHGQVGPAHGQVGPAQEQPAPTRKRGRETAGDMIRSLGLVLILVVTLWFFAQPPDSDEQEIRVVDPTADLAAFSADVPDAPVPGPLPEQWRATSSTLVGEPSGLRIGWVTPSGGYAEYAASTAPPAEHLPGVTGEQATRLGPVQVDGAAWEQYRDADGSLSLVRSYGPTVVVVGTLRGTAPLPELQTLAGALGTR